MESDKPQTVSKRAGRGVIRCYSGSFFSVPLQDKFQVRKGDALIDILIENFSSLSQRLADFC